MKLLYRSDGNNNVRSSVDTDPLLVENGGLGIRIELPPPALSTVFYL